MTRKPEERQIVTNSPAVIVFVLLLNLYRWVAFMGSVTVASDQQEAMRKMSASDKQKVIEALTVDLTRAGVGFGMDAGSDDVLKTIAFSNVVPITSKLTEDVFTANLDRIDNGVQLAKASIRLALAHRDAK